MRTPVFLIASVCTSMHMCRLRTEECDRHGPVGVCRRDGQRAYTAGGWYQGRRMRAADRQRMSHKGTNTARGREMIDCQVCVHRDKKEGLVSVSLSFN